MRRITLLLTATILLGSACSSDDSSKGPASSTTTSAGSTVAVEPPTEQEVKEARDVVNGFLSKLRDGDLDAAALYLDSYAALNYKEDVKALAEAARSSLGWLVSADDRKVFVTTAAGFTPPLVVTMTVPSAVEKPKRAQAFVVGQKLDGDKMKILRMDLTEPPITPLPGALIKPGDRVVLDGLPVEGGALAYVDDVEIAVDIDHEKVQTSVKVPGVNKSEIVITFSLATPEVPVAYAVWYSVDQ